MGITEVSEFSKGSKEIAKSITESECYSIIGGGDTGGFINERGMTDQFSYISTGGGAALEYLAGRELPGIEALN